MLSQPILQSTHDQLALVVALLLSLIDQLLQIVLQIMDQLTFFKLLRTQIAHILHLVLDLQPVCSKLCIFVDSLGRLVILFCLVFDETRFDFETVSGSKVITDDLVKSDIARFVEFGVLD